MLFHYVLLIKIKYKVKYYFDLNFEWYKKKIDILIKYTVDSKNHFKSIQYYKNIN